jgi:hypothetical protein
MPGGQSVVELPEDDPPPPLPLPLPPAAVDVVLAADVALPPCVVVFVVPPPEVCAAAAAVLAALLAWAGDASVLVGVSSGSLPQADDVVTPPVELSDTEHGMPCRRSAGSIPLPDEAAPAGAPDGPEIEPAAVGDAGLPVCACADAVRPKTMTTTNKRFMGHAPSGQNVAALTLSTLQPRPRPRVPAYEVQNTPC